MDDQNKLKRRRAGFEHFIEERKPVLVDFAEALELPEPQQVLEHPASYLPAISSWTKIQVVTPEDYNWIIVRIGYFIGELFAVEYQGSWFINETPGSRHFARYVVGRFGGFRNGGALIDPFEIAAEYLGKPPGRDLEGLVEEVRAELEDA